MAAKKSKTAKPRRSTSVPDTYRGFSIQATRFLFYLLNSPADSIVSLEAYEDVGVETADGTITAEQAKSYRTSNPLADRSVALWKTLRNWIEAASAGVLSPDRTRFVIYAPTAEMGSLAKAFHEADTIEKAKTALFAATQELKPNGKWDAGSAIQEHAEVVIFADLELAASVIAASSIDTANDSLDDNMRALLLDKFVGPESFDLVIRQAHGWVKQQIDGCVATGKSVFVNKNDFHESLLNFVRTHDRVNILRSVAGVPSKDQIDEHLAVRDYVRQLRIINLDDVDILQAVNDFLTAAIDRTVWSEHGLITESSTENLSRELQSAWRNKRRRVTVAHPSITPDNQGQLVYIDCMEHDAKLDGLETPHTFIRGSWHALADEKAIGWHPQFLTQLTSGSSSDGKDFP
jgi:hypothetical protein